MAIRYKPVGEVHLPRVRASGSLLTHELNRWSFIECDTCRAKPGSPMLCEGCQHNRGVIERLTAPGTTLTDRVAESVRRHPGRTAWGVAKELGASPGTVSSILRRLAAKGGRLRRAIGSRGSWVYYDRRFGHDR